MLEFIKKHKQELKRPLIYIVVGVMIFSIGYLTDNLDQSTTIVFGAGPIIFAIRDIGALIIKDKDLL